MELTRFIYSLKITDFYVVKILVRVSDLMASFIRHQYVLLDHIFCILVQDLARMKCVSGCSALLKTKQDLLSSI